MPSRFTCVPGILKSRSGRVRIDFFSTKSLPICEVTLSGMASFASLGLPWLRMLKASTLLWMLSLEKWAPVI